MDESTLPRFVGSPSIPLGTQEQQDYMVEVSSGNGGKSCWTIKQGFKCTRENGHKGPHIAKALGTLIVAVWDGEK